MHLDVRSCYSFHDGVAPPAELCAHAAELGFTELGVADVDGTYGLIQFYKAALKAGLKPVLGLALTDPEAQAAAGVPAQPGEPAAWIYARNRQGYSELCWLAAWRQGCLEDSAEAGPRRRGAAAAGAGHGSLAAVLSQHTEHCMVVSDREPLLAYLTPRLGPERVYARLDGNYDEAGRARQLRQLKLAARCGLRPLACTDVRFVRPQDQVLHHTLRAIGQNATLYSAAGVRPRQHYLAAPTELPGLYYDCPEALANTRHAAGRCEVDFELGKWVFPDFPLAGGADPCRALLQLCRRGLAWLGIGGAGRLEACPAGYTARLEMELAVIEQLGYTSYFLAVYDIVREARRLGIPHVGRGSAANSLVSYLLGLTPVDPLRYDMYFERFLNPQRTSPPDIDIDFNWKRRDEILNYVYQRWGASRVAMISTHVTYRARSAIREVAKVFGLGDAEISAVSKFLPHISASGLPTAQRDFPELRGVDFASEPYCHVLPLASRLDGKPRHLGIHCGGIVIAPGRITDFSGLQRAAKGFVVTQYDMFPVEDVGLIKIDLLGNRSLGVLEDTLASIGRRPPLATVSAGADRRIRHSSRSEPSAPLKSPAGTQALADIRRAISDWETLATDPASVAMIREGLTMGCFYIESPGMRQLLRRLRTQTFLDLTAASSVIRPGVAESGMMQEYIRRVRGESAKMPTHPLMREIMPETHGVMIYQEDVIKVAHRAAGMSLADADLLRRAMSGKLRSQAAMNEIRERFIAGCEGQGIDIASALEIWRQIASFAGYSFCKAHSASFATLSFQVAYLKAHYPAHFMAAVLSNGGGFYGPRAYLSECERLGLRVLPPDVNYSRLEYTAEAAGARDEGAGIREAGEPGGRPSRPAAAVEAQAGTPALHPPSPCNAVRVGLAVINGVTAALLARSVAERERYGPFRSLPQFIRRTRPGQRDVEVLIKCGALDSLGLTRPELLWLAQIERKAMVQVGSMAPADPRRAARAGKPPPAASSASPVTLPLDDAGRIADFRERIGSTLDDYDELKLCELELEHLGLLVRRHPLTLFAHYAAGVVNARDLPRYTGRFVRLLGWCIATKRVDLTRRQAVRDTLELQAEHSDRPEPSPTDEQDEPGSEREGTAEDLGIVLRPVRPLRPNNAAVTAGATARQGSVAEDSAGYRRAMKFMSMEDLTGTFEVTLFADAYARFAPLTRYSGPFLVTGRVEEQFDTYTVNATALQLLHLDDDAAPPHPGGHRDGATRGATRANPYRR